MAKRVRFFNDAPLSVSFILICMAVLFAARFFPAEGIAALFCAPTKQNGVSPFDWKRPLDYLRLFIHVFGHRDWTHFTAAAAFILLPGPDAEERYGSAFLLFMTAVCAFSTGVLNTVFFGTTLCGADGIVFLLLVLGTFANVRAQTIALTHVLLFVLYLAGCLFVVIDTAHAAPLIQIAGGLCASVFGFAAQPVKRTRKK